jgi:hypothetical protein
MSRPLADIAADAATLHAMWRAGALGGAVMPEDAHPALPSDSDRLAAYFTLGMALNYQRNSYALWRACTVAHDDPASAWVFDPLVVAEREPADLAAALLRHRVALQPNRHPAIWRRNAEGLARHAGGSVRTLFRTQSDDLGAVRAFLAAHKPEFPYLCGPKIANYWLYVMSSYMAWPLTGRAALSVAPDRHVVAGAIRLGLVSAHVTPASGMPLLVAERFAELLAGTELSPIDLHTPLWLWSRAGFPALA